MTDERSAPDVVAMMRAVYAEDGAASTADHRRFHLTIKRLLAEPSRGRIILISEGAAILGYALLIPFWSNEFGGTLLFVDERSEEHTSELQSHLNLVCRLLLEKKKQHHDRSH